VSQRVRHNWTTGHSTAEVERKRERKRDSWGRGGRKKAEEGGLSPESYTSYKNQTKWDHTLKHKHEPIKNLCIGFCKHAFFLCEKKKKNVPRVQHGSCKA